jgi:Tfp pilus assembly protein PilZ
MKENTRILTALAAAQFAVAGIGIALSSPEWLRAVEVFALMPLAGMSIQMVRRWSTPVFLCAIAWTCQQYWSNWREIPAFPSFLWFLLAMAANATVVSYYLAPAVRRAFFVPPLKWWETRPRYSLRLSATIVHRMRKNKATIANLSAGGAFLRTPEDLDIGDLVELKFSVLTQDYCIPAEVCYALKGATSGYGIQFNHTPETHERMNRLVYCLEVLGTERSRDSSPWDKKRRPASPARPRSQDSRAAA